MERIKPYNEQQLFMRKVQRNNQPKLEINNTPIRQRTQNKENMGGLQNKFRDQGGAHQYEERDSINPYIQESAVNNSRTIPKRKVSVVTKGCVNHGEVEAEFMIQIDGESLVYCGKCAAHLASNGFKVQRIVPSRSPRRIKDLPRSPSYNKRRQQLTAFIQSLKQLENGYMDKEEEIAKVQQSHEVQKQTITNFYSSLFEYMEYIRDEHLGFLDEEAKRSTQICEIEADQIGQTLEEVKAMREDIETNVNKIVEEVQQDSYLECMAYYNQKRGVHEHRLSQLGKDARSANFTTTECVQQKLNEFKDFIDSLSGILSSKADSLPPY